MSINMGNDYEFQREEINYIIKESEIIRKELVRLESSECRKNMDKNMRLAAVKFNTTIFRELLRRKEMCRLLMYYKETTIVIHDDLYD